MFFLWCTRRNSFICFWNSFPFMVIPKYVVRGNCRVMFRCIFCAWSPFSDSVGDLLWIRAPVTRCTVLSFSRRYACTYCIVMYIRTTKRLYRYAHIRKTSKLNQIQKSNPITYTDDDKSYLQSRIGSLYSKKNYAREISGH